MATVKVDDHDDRVGRILADSRQYFADARLRAQQEVDAETIDTLMQTTDRRDGVYRRVGIPAAAAAAVVAIVIAGYAILGRNDSRNGFAPVGTISRTPSTTGVQGSTPSQKPGQTPGSATKSTVPAAVSKPVGKPDPMYRSCIDLVREKAGVLERLPENLTGKLAIGNGKGITVVVASRSNAYACNVKPDSALSTPRPLDSAVAPVTFAVADNVISNSLPEDPGEMVWSGGALPAGVSSVTYTFPDGHRERAVTQDGYWAMQYFSPKWFAHVGQSVDEVDPIKVTVDGAGGRRELTLEWGTHTCDQVSHGC